MPTQNRNENKNDPSNSGEGPSDAIPAGALTLPQYSRYVLVSTAGTITGQLKGDTSDKAYALPVGLHKLAFKSVTSSATIVGFFVY